MEVLLLGTTVRTGQLVVEEAIHSGYELHCLVGVIICSAWGIAETRDDIPGWLGWLVDHSNIRYAYVKAIEHPVLIRRSPVISGA